MAGANLAKLTNVLPSQIPDSPKSSYCKFAKVFLTKTLKQLIRQSFTLPEFYTIIAVYHAWENFGGVKH